MPRLAISAVATVMGFVLLVSTVAGANPASNCVNLTALKLSDTTVHTAEAIR